MEDRRAVPNDGFWRGSIVMCNRYIYIHIYTLFIYIYKCLCTDCVRVVWPVEDLLQYVYSPVQFV